MVQLLEQLQCITQHPVFSRQLCIYDRAVAAGAAGCCLLVLSVSSRPLEICRLSTSRLSRRTQQLHQSNLQEQAERGSQGS